MIQKTQAYWLNVFNTIPQRRHADGDDIQSIEQILAQMSLSNCLQWLSISGTNKPHIALTFCAFPDARIGPGLNEAQQFGLQVHIHLTDLIQEQGPAIGQICRPGPIRNRPGERAFAMTEYLCLHQFARNGPAIQRNERFFPSGALCMDGMSAQLFACSGFTRDKYTRL